MCVCARTCVGVCVRVCDVRVCVHVRVCASVYKSIVHIHSLANMPLLDIQG